MAVAWASIDRLLDSRPLDHVPWVIIAGLIGAVGNELVAEYRINVGRRIASAALIADGHHARADALTSLAVVAAGIGAALGATWVDPVAGLVVAGLILFLLRRSAGRVFGRLLDGVDPALVDQAAAVAGSVDGVVSVDDIRMRWHGHRMLITLVVGVDPNLPVRDGHRIAEAVNHELIPRFRSRPKRSSTSTPAVNTKSTSGPGITPDGSQSMSGGHMPEPCPLRR